MNTFDIDLKIAKAFGADALCLHNGQPDKLSAEMRLWSDCLLCKEVRLKRIAKSQWAKEHGKGCGKTNNEEHGKGDDLEWNTPRYYYIDADEKHNHNTHMFSIRRHHHAVPVSHKQKAIKSGLIINGHTHDCTFIDMYAQGNAVYAVFNTACAGTRELKFKFHFDRIGNVSVFSPTKEEATEDIIHFAETVLNTRGYLLAIKKFEVYAKWLKSRGYASRECPVVFGPGDCAWLRDIEF